MRRSGGTRYAWLDTLSNAALALMHQGADLLANLLFINTAYAWVWSHGLKLFSADLTGFAVAFLLQDFLYYWFHRASHRVRWLWASHVTHHSSERLNLSTAFRQSLTYPISGMWVFWLPMAWVGFAPDLIILVVGLNLAFQFFVHTELTGRPGRLGWLFNTPSMHRVHHARNPGYIDRNFAGVLTIWDRLFGTYVAETERPEYGIVRQLHTRNPLALTFHEWRDMFNDVWRERDWRYLIKPPEWVGPGRLTGPSLQADQRRRPHT